MNGQKILVLLLHIIGQECVNYNLHAIVIEILYSAVRNDIEEKKSIRLIQKNTIRVIYNVAAGICPARALNAGSGLYRNSVRII